ncbi:uncharacterized protein [Typha latifolia]|uniref:uncharacterized protein n=1 Tax=Typha latifolia TaxID=4733 RepID=UPI003C2E7861
MKRLLRFRRFSLPLLQNSRLFLRFISSHPPRPSNPNPRKSSGIYFSNILLSNLAQTHGIKEARSRFDEMPQRDVVSYATMINLYLKSGDFLQAEELFRQVPERTVVIDSMMVDGYIKSGQIEEAQKLFDEMGERNVVSWTSLVSGYCQIGWVDEARRLFDEMPVRNVVSWTTMVLGYARNGLLSEARKLFECMPERNVVAWTAMIKGYVDNDQVGEAMDLFERMPHRNLYSWNIMIFGYLNSKEPNKAIELFAAMPQRNEISWTSMITGLGRNGFIVKAREFFDQMPKKDIAAWNAMIKVYADEGLMDEARELFDVIPTRDLVTWNTVLDGYAKNEHKEEALKLFICMLHSSVKLNETTLTSFLIICECITETSQIHGLAIKLGFQSEISLGNALVTMYSRAGDLCSSWLAFKRMDSKDVVSWTSMILAYANHGCGNYALQAFSQMLKHGYLPDCVTFIGVLSACSHASLVGKGRKIFDSMTRAYNLEPKAEHFSCLVDLLGRAGHIDEAKAVVDEMPATERDEVVLGTLLGACRVHNEAEIAKEVGEELIDLDLSSSGGYTLLANVYASHGKWNDVALLRKKMKERKVKKVAGFSQINVNMKNHVFYVGDQTHPQAKEIHQMLKEILLPQMKETESFQMIQPVHA